MKFRILAMLGLCDSTDFNLSDIAHNREVAKDLLSKKRVDLPNTFGSDYLFFRTGTWDTGGYIALYNQVKDLLGYLVKFERPLKLEGFDRPVVQTCVWRSLGDPAANGLARKVFFDVLLSHYGTIVSDKLQTPAGRDFWKILMATADRLGYRVAFIRKREILEFKPADVDIVDWYESFKTWGTDQKNQLERFLITKF